MNISSFIASEIDRRPAFLIFTLIFSLTASNAIFNVLAFSVGYEYPYSTFLFNPTDRFADYFKTILSFPGAKDLHIEGTTQFSALLSSYLDNNPYKGAAGLVSGQLTHFHSAPLTILIQLVNLKLMHNVNPVTLFVFVFLLEFTLAYKFISEISFSKADFLFLFLSLLLCYPTLMMVTRGHIYSGAVSLSLLAFLVCMYQEKRRYLALILLAVAVNLRPNAIVFIFALGLCRELNLKKKDIPIFIGITALIFLTSIYFANLMYVDYTISNFLSALGIYHTIYVVGNGGLAFGSSLFGGLKAIFGYSKLIEILPVALAALLVVISAVYLNMNKISKIAYIFILCASYVLGSSVIADYYLTVFFAPLLCLYLESGKGCSNVKTPTLDKEALIIFLSSVFVLCPKSYIYSGGISWQVVLNPFALLLASIYIIIASGLRPTGNCKVDSPLGNPPK